jgi:phosphatidylserine/phosphatidylglycerophosphate/cardiolipin synthase-like enzyme
VGFGQVFDAAAVRVIGTMRQRLADPARGSIASPPGHHEVYRAGAARHAGRELEWLALVQATPAPATLVAPCKAVARHVELDGGGGIALELSPLPFADDVAPVLRALRPGVPTFYVQPFDATDPALADEAVIAAGTPLAAFTGPLDRLHLAVQFQDPYTTPARTWIAVIGAALPPADQPAWLAQYQAFDLPRSLTVTDHGGGPRGGLEVPIAITDTAGTVELTLTTTVAGDLEEPARLSSITTAGGVPVSSLLAPPPDVVVELRPRADAAAAIPVLAIYEHPAAPVPNAPQSAHRDRALVLPVIDDPVAGHRTLQWIDLAHWLPAPRTATMQQFHPDCQVRPLVDGGETYALLRADFAAATGAGFGAYCLGWVFNDFALGLERDATTFIAHVEAILGSGGDFRFLTNQFFNFSDPQVTTAQLEAAALLVVLCLVIGLLARSQGETSWPVVVIWYLLPLAVLLANVVDMPDLMIDLIPNFPDARPAIDAVNALATAVGTTAPVARFSAPRAGIGDNPLADDYDHPLFGLENDIASVGANHTKMQVVRYHDPVEPDADDVSHVAYIGGMDINQNRRDTPSHRMSSYHDVHCRLRGGVVADAFTTFAERWDAEAGDLPRTIPTPDPAALRAYPEDPHLAQLVRTYHRPRTPATEWPFAPTGDDGSYRGMLAAIEAATDVIYIEDQYLTPDDHYLDVLCAAAGQCKRLAILVPDSTDQPFGAVRQRVCLDRLQAAWGDKMVVGMPTTHAVLGPPDAAASLGRAVLAKACTAVDTQIDVMPPSRMQTTAPVWCWIHGELMLVTAISAPIEEDGKPLVRRLDVIRGATAASPRWSATPRAHLATSPVTFIGMRTVFVHAKCMTVDDMFVSIGSANVNRRGFFHDAEGGVIAVPQRLHGADDNPARDLRTRLWAEQLGMPPELGRALLRDPLAGFDLFLRPRLLGNRYTPLSATDPLPFMAISDLQLYPLSLFDALGLLTALPAGAVLALHERAWNLGGDPTSDLELEPHVGPTYHPPDPP